MAKIMLVEDDNNLREIYEARLLAEGHEIVSAHDGEEALALAVREKPDLIISDVMMPKISGFDMLDILRGSPETKNTKVIMMTALSQLEDKDRADRLGADRYLVKSQVTLEDVVRVAREVLEGTADPGLPVAPPPVAAPAAMPPAPAPDIPAPKPAPAATAPAPPATPVQTAPPAVPVAAGPSQAAPAPAATAPAAPAVPTMPAAATPPAQPVADPAASVATAQTTATEQQTVESQIAAFENQPAPAPLEAVPAEENSPAGGVRVIQPLNDIETKPDLNALLAKEEENERLATTASAAAPPTPAPPAVNPANAAAPPAPAPAAQPSNDNPANVAL